MNAAPDVFPFSWIDANLLNNPMLTRDTAEMFWHGLTQTAHLVIVSLLLGLILAVPFAIMRSSRTWWLNKPVWCFTYLFRGTPLLIQLYLIYYGLGFTLGESLDKDSLLGKVIHEPLYSALLAFTLNTAAYTTEIFRGAIKATPHGEIEAARSFGMSRSKMLKRIILPSALRRALPAYGNEIIFMLHASTIASVITLMDVTGVAYYLYSRFYAPFTAFIIAALLYMVLSFIVQSAFRQFEKRMLAHMRPVA